ncbi:FAD/NAD(P)-binding domain-containing protein [Mycena latifolia]|nr:FAD/NAD(P)-binding domain-containing protein [Mycena latifolia]
MLSHCWMEPHPDVDSPPALDISIVGAGIGGLSAAISLRRNGHNIRIFETAPRKTEIGAGVGFQVNALRILRRLGYARENLKGTDFDGAVVFDAADGSGRQCPWLIPRPEDDHALFCARSDIHDELMRLAIGEGEGPPAQLHLDSKVVECDPEAGTVALGDGQTIHADVVIGADGIHSVVRTSILGYPQKATLTGWTCYRFLINARGLSEIPELAWFTEGLSGARHVIMRGGTMQMLFMYPCRDGSVINFAGFYSDPDQEKPDWKPTATREEILERFQGFHPKFLRILDLPAESPIVKWQLRTVPLLPTWIRGRAALLGDSAHGTLPTLGQGGAMAIEEAAALGCLFPLGTTRDEVPARLAAYQALRKERGEYVNTESVAQAGVPEKRGEYLRSREMQATIIEHDAIKSAQEYYDVNFGGHVKG